MRRGHSRVLWASGKVYLVAFSCAMVVVDVSAPRSSRAYPKAEMLQLRVWASSLSCGPRHAMHVIVYVRVCAGAGVD